VIPLFRPSLGEEELANLAEVFRSGYITLGPKTAEFETRFAAYQGSRHAVGLANATIALQMSLDLCGVEGGEVLVPPLTFVSTVAAAVYNRAKPVYVDVDPVTLNMDPTDLERKITSRSRAIVPVHYGGHPCEMDGIMELSATHNIPVVEDCAHATGSMYKDQMVGTFGIVGCFSFHAVKPLATGDGAMATTQNDQIDRDLRQLRWLGATKDTHGREAEGAGYDWYYEIDRLGYKAYMNDITAAIGLAQLEKQSRLTKQRRDVAKMYDAAFSNVDWIETPVENMHTFSVYHNYAIKLDSKRVDRAKFIDHMKQRGVTVGVHYLPIYKHTYYRDVEASTPVAEEVWQRLALLPLYADMTPNDVACVVDSVLAYPVP
jgi:perosamine synthetase